MLKRLLKGLISPSFHRAYWAVKNQQWGRRGESLLDCRNVLACAVGRGSLVCHIRDRFDTDQVKALQRIRWWDWDAKTLAQRNSEFLDIEAFLCRYDQEYAAVRALTSGEET